MKRYLVLQLLIAINLMCVYDTSKAQSDISGVVTGHIGAGNTTYYVGWDAATTFDLNIKHLAANRNINFYTVNNPRMRILPGGLTGNGATTDGFIGIGDFNFFAPSNLLHQHLNYNRSNYHQFTNSFTGNLASDGLLMGLTFNPVNLPQQPVISSSADIVMQESGPIRFWTGNLTNNTVPERLIVTTGHFRNQINNAIGFNVARVGIHYGGSMGALYEPLSSLHISSVSIYNAIGGTGYRNWMNLGTLVNNGCHMFTGMKMEGLNRADAIVNWGDDLTGNGSPDFMRFVFTEFVNDSTLHFANPTSNFTSFNGEEVMRYAGNGNVGVGNYYFYGINTFPNNRFEILDANPNSLTNANSDIPQLRLTYTYDANPALGVHTDFQNTSTGDLQINTTNGTYQRVGINNATNTLTQTLDVNGNLRLRTLPTATFDATNNAAINKVLVTNNFGEIYWRTDIGVGGGGNLNMCPLTAPDLNYVVKITGTNSPYQICKTAIYENAALNVGIGTTAISAKLHVKHSSASSFNGFISEIDGLSTGTEMYAGNFVAQNGTGRTIGVKTNAFGNASNTGNYGILSEATGYAGKNALGGHFYVVSNGVAAQLWGVSANVNGKADVMQGVSSGVAGTATYQSFAGRFENTATVTDAIIGKTFGGSFVVTGQSAFAYGVYALANGSATREQCGGYFEAAGNALSTPVRFGVKTQIIGTPSNDQYALWAKSASSNCNTTCTQAAGYFTGDVFTTSSMYFTSDSILKKNITPISAALNILQQLKPKSYEYENAKYPQMNLPVGLHSGLVAQDIEKVLPGLVMHVNHPAEYDSTGKVINQMVSYKGINYIELIPWLISGIQEQQTQITNLQNQINSCCPNNSKGTNSSHTITTKLTDIETIILDQNEPNPFAEETNISYFIPESAGKAEIMFYTNDGRLINKVEIKEKGQGTLHIYASDLSSGIYTYTLMVNGKVVETKKMMKSK